MKNLLFSVDEHDKDGDVTDKCVLLHIGKTLSLRFDDGEELEHFAKRILDMIPEIREQYPHAFSDMEG